MSKPPDIRKPLRNLDDFTLWPKGIFEEEQESAKGITVNKRTQRVRYENETEDSVDVVIEKKDGKQ
jgi:hypothetical protein